MNKFRMNDSVIVISGQDRGKIGKIEKFLSNGKKIVVSGVNSRIKSVKRDPNRNIEGGLNSINLPIDVSNVAIFNQETNKKDKVKFSVSKDGDSVLRKRTFASTAKEIEVIKDKK